MERNESIRENFAYWRARGRTASVALELAKTDLAAGKRRYGACNRAIVFNPASEDSGARWIENAANGLRLVGFADEIGDRWNRAVNHKGWFTSEFQDETYRGIVYRLPHKRFAYGYADPNNASAARLQFSVDQTLDEREAAQRADHFAEREAETEREYQEDWQAGRRYREDLPESIAEARRRFLALARKAPSLDRDAANTRWLRELADSWCDLRKERTELRDRYGRTAGFADA